MACWIYQVLTSHAQPADSQSCSADESCTDQIPADEFRCTCEDNGLLGRWEGELCDVKIGANVPFFVTMGLIICLGSITIGFGFFVFRMRLKHKARQIAAAP
jgi:hypothetical protein